MPDDRASVLLIYTGGTIGSAPIDRLDPQSPLAPISIDDIMWRLPNYRDSSREIAIGSTLVTLHVYSWIRPVDSSNIELSDWEKIGQVVCDKYRDYDGFVILHGTDTMAYSASVLAFMLRDLAKPVIFTGSQIPLDRTRTDAVQNLVTAIEIAAAEVVGGAIVPEVTIFFRDRLYRGCRTTKSNSSSFEAFASPNCLPLAEAGEQIRTVGPALVPSATGGVDLHISSELERNIAAIELFPGMSPALLRNILATEDLRGVVILAFGAGNAPSSREFLSVIEEAVKREIVVLGVTQCRSGEVELGLYEVSAGLLARGVVSGLDMTLEAALAKLCVILGREKDHSRAVDRLQLNLRGEQRQSAWNLYFGGGVVDGNGEARLTLARSSDEVAVKPTEPIMEKGLIRVVGIQALTDSEMFVDLEFSAVLDYQDDRRAWPLARVVRLGEPDAWSGNAVAGVSRKCLAPLMQADATTVVLTVRNRSNLACKWDRVIVTVFISSVGVVYEKW